MDGRSAEVGRQGSLFFPGERGLWRGIIEYLEVVSKVGGGWGRVVIGYHSF